jgi:hypothetical protein
VSAAVHASVRPSPDASNPCRSLPADVLVCPKRIVPRLSALRPDEVADLFLAVQRVAAVVEEAYGGQSCTVSCQSVALARAPDLTAKLPTIDLSLSPCT